MQNPAGAGGHVTTRILICDDDKVFADMIRAYLDYLGYGSLHCLDVNELRFFTGKHRPSLVILDMQIGGGGGSVAASILPASVPIIVVSGMPVEQQRAWFKDRAAIRFFQKPIDNKLLGEAVRELLPPAPQAPCP